VKLPPPGQALTLAELEQVAAANNPTIAAAVSLIQQQEGLRQGFHISHTTIQVEAEGCGPNEMYRTPRPVGHGHEEHGHG
jgi:hypothetical protein